LGPTPVLLSALVFLAVAISLLSLWVARSLTAPLTRFADAAERFSVAMPHKDSGFQIGVKR
jgi:HAMP domain-containing protein